MLEFKFLYVVQFLFVFLLGRGVTMENGRMHQWSKFEML